jgi:hypothetical protein
MLTIFSLLFFSASTAALDVPLLARPIHAHGHLNYSQPGGPGASTGARGPCDARRVQSGAPFAALALGGAAAQRTVLAGDPGSGECAVYAHWHSLGYATMRSGGYECVCM